MSIIFPGNYVAHLNAYREQGVAAIPGVEFYRAVGAVVLNPDNDNVLTLDNDGNSVLLAGNYTAQILSPDLRQDDKPRKDKALVIPAGSVVYRTAVSAPGVKANAAGDTVTVKTAAGLPTAVPVTAAASLYFPAEGASSSLSSLLDGTPVATATTIELTTSATFAAQLDPSAGACRNSPSALLVEVCYYRPAAAPDVEDAHVPFATEAGQGY
jgi:hypothetical protein